jgi:3-methylfumaryl-CoA hydratase
MSDFSPLIDAAALAHLQTWQGKSETTPDSITTAPLRALSATLDRDDAPPAPGSVVPPLWHWLYFLPHARQSEIGPTATPARRLSAAGAAAAPHVGGRLRWEAATAAVGQEVQRAPPSSRSAQGRPLGRAAVRAGGAPVPQRPGLALTEEHDIVYRPLPSRASRTAPQKPPLAGQAAWSRTIVPDDVLLFRYSALTFNGHRIHYDRQYVTQVEGYPA